MEQTNICITTYFCVFVVKKYFEIRGAHLTFLVELLSFSFMVDGIFFIASILIFRFIFPLFAYQLAFLLLHPYSHCIHIYLSQSASSPGLPFM